MPYISKRTLIPHIPRYTLRLGMFRTPEHA